MKIVIDPTTGRFKWAENDHTRLLNIGTNSHAAIDTFIGTTVPNTYQTKLVNSAGLLAALSDETGTGLAVFNNAPAITNPSIDGGFTAAGTYAGTNISTYLADATNIKLTNSAVSTGSTDLKYPPAIILRGSGWTGSAAQITEHAILSDPMYNGNPVFRIYKREGGSGSWTQIFSIDENGQFGTDINRHTYDSREVVTQGMRLGNDAAATSGYDQYSPVFIFRGNGWKTDATAASRNMSCGVVMAPEQGAASPIGVLKTYYGTNTSVPVEANELMRLEWGDRLGATFNNPNTAGFNFRINGNFGFNIAPAAQQAGIADADGSLADITTKFNSLIAKLETYGLLAVA